MTRDKALRASQITFRCSAKLLQTVDACAAAREGGVSRNEMVEHFVNQFIMNPEFLDPVDIQPLREPVAQIVVLNVSSGIKARVERMAVEQNVSVSALMRNIIFVGVTEEERVRGGL